MKTAVFFCVGLNFIRMPHSTINQIKSTVFQLRFINDIIFHFKQWYTQQIWMVPFLVGLKLMNSFVRISSLEPGWSIHRLDNILVWWMLVKLQMHLMNRKSGIWTNWYPMKRNQVKTYSNSRIFLVVFIHLQMIYTKIKRISKIGEKDQQFCSKNYLFNDLKKRTMWKQRVGDRRRGQVRKFGDHSLKNQLI